MIEYNKLSVKLSKSPLNKLKAAVKKQTGVTLRINIKMFGGDKLPREVLLATRQKRKLRHAFENNMSTDIRLSKTQISKIIQPDGFLSVLLSKIVGPLMKVAVPSAKNILARLEITAAVSAIDAGVKKTNGFGTTTLMISNEEMNEIIKVAKDFKDSNILLKGITETIENETKEQKWGFLGMLLGALGASLLWNVLTGKGIARAGYGNNWGEWIVGAVHGSKKNK